MLPKTGEAGVPRPRSIGQPAWSGGFVVEEISTEYMNRIVPAEVTANRVHSLPLDVCPAATSLAKTWVLSWSVTLLEMGARCSTRPCPAPVPQFWTFRL